MLQVVTLSMVLVSVACLSLSSRLPWALAAVGSGALALVASLLELDGWAAVIRLVAAYAAMGSVLVLALAGRPRAALPLAVAGTAVTVTAASWLLLGAP